MTGIVIDGRAIAKTIHQQLAAEISDLKKESRPGLAVIQIGDDPAIAMYIANKQKACEKIGIHFWKYHFPDTTNPGSIRQCINDLNKDSSVHGILLQLPLPAHYPVQSLIDCINPEKDIDGLTTESVGRLWNNQPGFIPCTPLGCIDLLKTQFSSLKGKIVTILGRSAIVGRPLSSLLLKENATVVISHSKTIQPEILCQQSDIIIAAVGKPSLVKASWVKPGAVVIDVGINHIRNDGTKVLQGDVDFEAVLETCKAITPVPGGVGPMTVAYLLKNVLKAFKQHNNF